VFLQEEEADLKESREIKKVKLRARKLLYLLHHLSFQQLL